MSLLLLLALAARAATLAEYMDAAEANNPRGVIAASNAATAAADALTAGSALLPTVRVNAAWTYNQYAAVAFLPDPQGGPPEEIIIVPREQRTAVVTARVPLLDGAAIASWQASRDGTEAAREDGRAALQDLRLAVARAWYAAVAAQEVVAAAERAKAAAEENLRYLTLREAAGAATALSVQRAELEVANAEQLRVDALRTAANARRALATASGLPEPDALPVVPADLAEPPPEAELLAIAETERPELAAANARLERVKWAKSGAWLAAAPTVAGVATETLTNASGFSGQQATWTVGLQLDWAVLDLGNRAADLQRARAAYASADATLRQARDTVRDEVHAAWLDVDAARAKLVAARRGADVSRATADQVGQRLRAGTATQLEVIQAERDALDAEVLRIRAEGELAIARLALQRATGDQVGGGEIAP